MTPRDAARGTLAVGWAAGVVTILCGLPLAVAVAVLAGAIVAAWSARWWFRGLVAWTHSRLQKAAGEERP